MMMHHEVKKPLKRSIEIKDYVQYDPPKPNETNTFIKYNQRELLKDTTPHKEVCIIRYRSSIDHPLIIIDHPSIIHQSSINHSHRSSPPTT